MNIGVIGLGKIGLVWALTLQHYGGHKVSGFDVRRDRVLARLADAQDHGEEGLGHLIQRGTIDVEKDVRSVLESSDVVFICVQTPHPLGYDGSVPMPEIPSDFNYLYLAEALRSVMEAAVDVNWQGVVVVMSTVLPGTCRKMMSMLEPAHLNLVYSPAFISLGTVVHDLLNPHWVIIGTDDNHSGEIVRSVHYTLDARQRAEVMSLESAELTKIALNVWITTQITFVNELAEVADQVGANVDVVTTALQLGRSAGMGDGGACRPRDIIALRSICPTFFTDLTRARERHARWLAKIITRESLRTRLPIAVLGKSYKQGVSYTDGSPASLLVHYLTKLEVAVSWWWDPYVDALGASVPFPTDQPFIAVYATNHLVFDALLFPRGSIVIDPWGTQTTRDGVTLIQPGRRHT